MSLFVDVNLRADDLRDPLKDADQDITLTYEEAIQQAGPSSSYQVRIGFIIALGMIIAGLQIMAFPFIFQVPSAQCLQNGVWSDCTPDADTCQNPIRPQEGSYNTVSNTFKQYCTADASRILVETSYMIASAFGVLFVAPIADRYGKRVALLISYIVTCASLLALPFVHYWGFFVALIILSGLGRAPFVYYGFQLLVEVSNENFRGIGVLIMGVAFAMGASLAGVLNSAVGFDWQKFYLFFLAIPSVVGVPFVYFWADESPLSFLSAQKYNQARDSIKKIAQVNKRKLSCFHFAEEKDILDTSPLLEERRRGASTYSYVDLFKISSLRKSVIGGAYISFATYFVFYGQMLAVDSLSANDPVAVSIITSIIEAIACIASTRFLTKLNRRTVLMMSFTLTAVAFAIFGLVKPSLLCSSGNDNCAQIQMYIGFVELSFGRFWIALLMCTMFVYANELFPTVLRSRGSGLVNFFGRVGSVLPSTVIYLCKRASISPALIFSAVAIPAIIVSWLMKETKGRTLPNFVGESPTEIKRPSMAVTDAC